jgi:hypothetical protein
MWLLLALSLMPNPNYARRLDLWLLDIARPQVYRNTGDLLRFTDDQIELAYMIGQGGWTVAQSANSTGKTYLLGFLPAWWLTTHEHGAHYHTGGTLHLHLRQMWREVELEHQRLSMEAGGWTYLRSGQITHKDPRRYSLALNPGEPNLIAGQKGGDELLAGIEEAGVVASEFPGVFSAVPKSNPACVVVTGNPNSRTNAFAEAYKNADRRMVMSMDSAIEWQDKHGKLPGLADRAMKDRILRLWPANSAYVRSAVYGQQPDDDASVIIPLSHAEAAVTRQAESGQGRFKLSCDVSRAEHGDRTVIGGGRPGRFKFLDVVRGRPLPATAAKLLELAQKADPVNGCDIVIDVTGLGVGVADILDGLVKGSPHKVIRFGFADGPVCSDFADKPSEAWYDASRLLDAGTVAIDCLVGTDDVGNEFKGEISTRHWAQGSKKPKVESKDDWRKQLPDGERARSPDLADAFIMWAWRGEEGLDAYAGPIGVGQERYRGASSS